MGRLAAETFEALLVMASRTDAGERLGGGWVVGGGQWVVGGGGGLGVVGGRGGLGRGVGGGGGGGRTEEDWTIWSLLCCSLRVWVGQPVHCGKNMRGVLGWGPGFGPIDRS